MKYSSVCILQSFGAGDLIWANSIANDFIDEGYSVLWPVDPIYASLSEHFPRITMVDKSLVSVNFGIPVDYIINGTRIIPLRFADSIMKVPYTQCMSAKYAMLGKDWTKWKENCQIKRVYKKESLLIWHLQQTVGFDITESYNLISEQFTTGGARSEKIIPPQNGLPNVYMSFIDGYTLIDWMTIIENATELHFIASSNIYLTELYMHNIKAKEGNNIHLYVRRPNEQNHDNYKYILSPTGYTLMP